MYIYIYSKGQSIIIEHKLFESVFVGYFNLIKICWNRASFMDEQVRF